MPDQQSDRRTGNDEESRTTSEYQQRCDECESRAFSAAYNYCPFCGADAPKQSNGEAVAGPNSPTGARTVEMLNLGRSGHDYPYNVEIDVEGVTFTGPGMETEPEAHAIRSIVEPNGAVHRCEVVQND